MTDERDETLPSPGPSPLPTSGVPAPAPVPVAAPSGAGAGPSPALVALLQAGNVPAIDRSRRIYVNRNLRLEAIDLIGFDMDYTLALYHLDRIEQLAVRETVAKLIRRGYPERIAGLRYDPSFAIRGLVVDKRTGNLFKMDTHRHVGRVFHGFRPVDRQERRRLYRKDSIRLSAPRYHLIDTLFALPEAFLFASLIDMEAVPGNRRPDYARLFSDIRECIDEAHRDDSIKGEIRRDPGAYVIKDPELAPTLHKFRSAGKRLFLMTNSLLDYTSVIMAYLLDGALPEYPSWRNYFDIIIVGAGKPGFFAGREPFLELGPDGQPVGRVHHRFERGRIYQGGCIREFERLAGTGADSILYVGDHIYGDVLRAKKASAWRTAMVVQEMEEEVATAVRLADEFRRRARLEEEVERLDFELNNQQSVLRSVQKVLEGAAGPLGPAEQALAEESRRRVRSRVEALKKELKEKTEEHERLSEALDAQFNRYWGQLFKEGSEHSVFGGQVEDYACLYTSRVSNFLRYSPQQYFRAPRDLLPHEIL